MKKRRGSVLLTWVSVLNFLSLFFALSLIFSLIIKRRTVADGGLSIKYSRWLNTDFLFMLANLSLYSDVVWLCCSCHAHFNPSFLLLLWPNVNGKLIYLSLSVHSTSLHSPPFLFLSWNHSFTYFLITVLQFVKTFILRVCVYLIAVIGLFSKQLIRLRHRPEAALVFPVVWWFLEIFFLQI